MTIIHIYASEHVTTTQSSHRYLCPNILRGHKAGMYTYSYGDQFIIFQFCQLILARLPLSWENIFNMLWGIKNFTN